MATIAAPFHHGLRLKIQKDQLPPIKVLTSGIILLVGTAPIGPVNDPYLILGNPIDSVATFGKFEPWHIDAGFTIPEALEAIFSQGAAPVVVINVNKGASTPVETSDIAFSRSGVLQLPKTQLDSVAHGIALSTTGKIKRRLPATGGLTINLPLGLTTVTAVKTSTGAAVTGAYVTGTGIYTVTAGAVAGEDLTLTLTGTWSATTDYEVDPLAGTIKIRTGSRLLPEMVMDAVDYNYLKVDLTTIATSVIGTVAGDGTRTGFKLAEAIPSKLGITPRLVLCPRLSDRSLALRHLASPVVNAMEAAAKTLGARVFASVERSMSLTDFTFDLTHYANEGSRVGILAWPYVKIAGPDGELIAQPPCARLAGKQVLVDNTEGFHESFSNRKLEGVLDVDKNVTHSWTEVVTESNYINERGGCVIVNEQGFFKGHGVWQPNGEMLSVLRTADQINYSIVYAQKHLLDRALGKERVRQVMQQIKALFRQLETDGVLIPNPNPSSKPDVWIDEHINSPEAIAAGKVSYSYRFNPPPLMTDITFIAHTTRDYLTDFVRALNVNG